MIDHLFSQYYTTIFGKGLKSSTKTKIRLFKVFYQNKNTIIQSLLPKQKYYYSKCDFKKLIKNGFVIITNHELT